MTTQPPTRRQRVRAATLDEIHQVARRLLVQDTIAGVTLRAIAREMGMTPAALYRYFPSLESLLASLCERFYDECRTEIERARDETGPDDPGARLYAMCRTFRAWSVTHPAEFNLMFASPLPTTNLTSGVHGAGLRFALSFADMFGELWQHSPFPVPDETGLDPRLAEQLHGFVDELRAQGARPVDLPIGAAHLYLSCWIRMYGIVALEVYGHLGFALSDVGPMFDAEMDSAAELLGLDPARYRNHPL
ncbi:TetR/AcrR family transcriptional regulator [Dactylosporangium fulvum]|uniref:TetR/AcrR family transcriptional regulator n=1 Tax=Dactylosporangium fulvum TaxID=53359 RepID=A0ABY5W297_9ACTN|nr:TetR/AcrR family transcriptional regulator [Dactylosporangium fulvum]UWP84157.1 TetR/AcrR family transcriptional regulator [Dactylosporangium fulvum]